MSLTDDARSAQAALGRWMDAFDPDTLGDNPAEFDDWLVLKNARDVIGSLLTKLDMVREERNMAIQQSEQHGATCE